MRGFIPLCLAVLIGLSQPAQAQEEQSWFYLTEGGQTTGPFDIAALRSRAAEGSLPLDALVWQEAQGEWLPMAEIAALAGIFEIAPPSDAAIADREAAALVTGLWSVSGSYEAEEEGYSERAQMVYEFDADGRYRARGTVEYNDAGTAYTDMHELTGTYSATAIAPHRFRVEVEGVLTVSFRDSDQSPEIAEVKHIHEFVVISPDHLVEIGSGWELLRQQ